MIYSWLMRIQTTHLGLRIGATLLAIGYGVVGWYAVSVSSEAPTIELADRAFWMGTTFIIASVLAATVSWLVADLSNIWCIPPRRTPQSRIRVDHDGSEQPPGTRHEPGTTPSRRGNTS